MLNQILADHTGQPIETIAKDTDRDFYMTAEAAKEYGIVDDILTKQKAEKDEEKRRLTARRDRGLYVRKYLFLRLLMPCH